MRIGELDAERRELLVGMGFSEGKVLVNLNGYPALSFCKNGKKALHYVHRIIAEHYLGVTLTRKTFVHHIDEDRWNFRLSNLHSCSQGEHNGIHRRFGEENHFFGKRHSKESRDVISEKLRGKKPAPLSKEARDRMSEFASARDRNALGKFVPMSGLPK